MASFEYSFPAVRGFQADREYYIAMLPLSLLSKIFSSDQEIEYLPPEYRAQRILNETRIPEITSYIIQNRNSYVFSSLSASINGDIKFVESDLDSNLGMLKIPMDSVFLINDGQHRKAAILQALNEDSSLKDETISIVFFKDEGLERAQQMFTDLNKHAVKSSKSLSTLYDNRNDFSKATRTVISKCEFLKNFTDFERDILGKNSAKFFTLANLYNANKKILRKEVCDDSDLEFLISFWQEIFENIVEWKEVLNGDLTKKALREDYILTLGVTILAFGRLGNYFYTNKNKDFKTTLKKLRKINWKRSASENWLNRAIRANGKVIGGAQAETMICSKVKMLLGIKLSEEELKKEKSMEAM